MTVCVVEIFGSLFQNICIQNVRSLHIGALMITIDFLQAVLDIKIYLSHKFIVDGKDAAVMAVKIVKSTLFPSVSKADQDHRYAASEHCKDKKPALSGSTFRSTFRKTSSIIFATGKKTTSMSPIAFLRDRSRSKGASAGPDDMLDIGSIDHGACFSPTSSSRNSVCAPGAMFSSLMTTMSGSSDGGSTAAAIGQGSAARPSFKARQKVYVDDITVNYKELTNLLTQTLQLLFASEVLIFVEYVEFIVPLIYGLYSLVLFYLPYTKYSLAFISMPRSDFRSAMTTTGLYAALECVSMLFMFYLVKKYGLLALYQLTFVLENYWMGVQGKLFGSLVLIFNLNTVHHGK